MHRRTLVAQGDEGLTLIELLVTIVIMGFAISALVSAMASLTVATEHHRGLASTDAAVRGWGEAIKQKAISSAAYVPCPQWDDLNPNFTFPAGTAADNADPVIEYWVPTSTSDPRTGSFTDHNGCADRFTEVCQGSVQSACDPGVQRITLKVVATDPSNRGGSTITQMLLRRGNTT